MEHLKSLKIQGFKSFAKPVTLEFPGSISAIVGPNGSGKSNVVESIAWVLGEQSIKSLRGKKGEDLIFNGSSTMPRMSKASVVLNFINPKNKDEFSVSRTVYRDGINEYFVNNKSCRLKDVIEILNKAGSGTLRQHIISQGEADKVLNASLRERRDIVEDLLGLRIFQLKKEEGKRKLDKTEENIKQTVSLQKEIQPHLRFLKKQVDKAEESSVLKEKLKQISSEYFSKIESKFVVGAKELEEQKKDPEKEYKKIEKETLETREKISKFGQEKEKMRIIREKANETEREIGRYEGMLAGLKRKKVPGGSIGLEPEKEFYIDTSKVEEFVEFLEKEIDSAFTVNTVEKIKAILTEIKNKIGLIKKKTESGEEKKEVEKEGKDLEKKHKELLSELEVSRKEEQRLQKGSETLIETERELHTKEIRLSELRLVLQNIEMREREIKFRKDDIKKDIFEIEAIIKEKLEIKKDVSFEDLEVEQGRRNIERIKIKIEESGSIGDEVMKEYDEIKTRDEFLTKEIADLEGTSLSLKKLIKQLEEKLDVDFKNGVEKINKEFQKFFELMFGGGSAELKIKKLLKVKVIKDEVLFGGDEGLSSEAANESGVAEEGVEIAVKLPKKRINSLEMLSGGERALTSIALLFALSRVNPPPFLILDETDAALDESNTRKYAKMLKDLSSQTQLILITHNRETMNAASILYGITMGSDGISRLLSLKLEEAEEIAQ
ncbi:MAG: AAA family ATPase [Patescibacteria group bacterium]